MFFTDRQPHLLHWTYIFPWSACLTLRYLCSLTEDLADCKGSQHLQGQLINIWSTYTYQHISHILVYGTSTVCFQDHLYLPQSLLSAVNRSMCINRFSHVMATSRDSPVSVLRIGDAIQVRLTYEHMIHRFTFAANRLSSPVLTS